MKQIKYKSKDGLCFDDCPNKVQKGDVMGDYVLYLGYVKVGSWICWECPYFGGDEYGVVTCNYQQDGTK